MFKIFALSLMTLSFSALAQNVTYCYKATADVPTLVPKVLCLENIYQGQRPGIINVDSKNQTVPYALKITELRRHNEDRVKFKAEYVYSTFEDRTHHCGDGLEAKLVVSGESTVGTIYPQYLDVSVEVLESNDVCHDYGNSTTIAYELVK